mgnify:FL=1
MAIDTETTPIDGLILLKPRVFKDARGEFLETYRDEAMREAGIGKPFVQDNISVSRKGTVRGLHYQLPPHGQAKLILAVRGAILDVAVDLRKGSPTYGKHHKVLLSEENRHLFYVPVGFAHGFSVLSEEATVYYKCSGYYEPAAERGVRWNDADLGIDWGVEEPLVSEKDRVQPLFGEVEAVDLAG